uniref:Uncharacterized protein n=1 Tax=Mizugakiibacter sediminis TaxID=1475481 RepID=A0A0U1PAS3_9GAMM
MRRRRGGLAILRALGQEHAQLREDAARGQMLVEAVVEGAGGGHHAAVEAAVQQQLVFQREFEVGGGALQRAGDRVGAERQGFGLDQRRGDQHAEAVAEFVQRDAAAHLGARGDVLQRQRLLQLALVDQLQRIRGDAMAARRRAVQRGELFLQCQQEARRHVGAAALDLAQAVEATLLFGVVARLLGMLEQLLLEVRQRGAQRRLEAGAAHLQQLVEQLAHARRQVGARRQRRRRGR